MDLNRKVLNFASILDHPENDRSNVKKADLAGLLFYYI